MQDARICPTCGGPVAGDAPQGACPKCMFQAGFATGGASTPEPRAPTIEELAPKFPGLVIEKLIGRGGMGVVYKARHKALDREVALKILPAENGDSPHFAERFQREARALAKLQHPNIVAVHDFGAADGLYWLVMEYVDGANIRQAMKAGAIGPKEALAIVPQICDALQYAHEHGVVHRDIKPENVLLDKTGRVKVADFGLAKLMETSAADATLTGAGQIMGTPHYMAPEQVEHPADVDHRADIYSLGVVFYEMLTGELPLGRFDPPSHRVHVDVRLDEVVLRSLEKAPERRYQQASQIKTQVGVIAEGPAPQRFAPPSEETITAPPTHSTMVNVPLDLPRREKLVSLALILGGVLWWLAMEREPVYLIVPLSGFAFLGLSLWKTLQTDAHRRRMAALLASAAISIGMLVVLANTLETQVARVGSGILAAVCAGLYVIGAWQLRAAAARGPAPVKRMPALLWIAFGGLALILLCGLAGALTLVSPPSKSVQPPSDARVDAPRVPAAAAVNALLKRLDDAGEPRALMYVRDLYADWKNVLPLDSTLEQGEAGRYGLPMTSDAALGAPLSQFHVRSVEEAPDHRRALVVLEHDGRTAEFGVECKSGEWFFSRDPVRNPVTNSIGRSDFATTRWSVVVAAGGPTGADARAALETLCATCWYPLYAYARRRGRSRHDAEDLVQGFFGVLLDRGSVAAADPQRGRFRAFLLTAFQRFAANEHERATAMKRGGGANTLSLDFDDGESRFTNEPSHDLTPEREFERRFALALLARALECVTMERPDDVDLLPFVGGAGDARPYAEIAARRGANENAVKAAVHRLRARYREILRAEIRETVAEDADVDDEIRHLLDVVAG